jgi:ElaB/YqjD/DUF883 family membrane-anchored ribosome-binding protein
MMMMMMLTLLLPLPLPLPLPLLLLQVTNNVFVAAMRWAAQATQPLLQAQKALAAAAVHDSSSSRGAVAAAAAVGSLLHLEDITSPQQQQQQQQQQGCRQSQTLPLLWPSQKLQATVEQLMAAPLQTLFKQSSSQQQQQQQQGNSQAASDKLSRAGGLTALRQQLFKDLQQMGLLADEVTADQPPCAAAAAAAAGLYSEADVLRAFDVLQSRVMRNILLQQVSCIAAAPAVPAAPLMTAGCRGRGMTQPTVCSGHTSVKGVLLLRVMV